MKPRFIIFSSCILTLLIAGFSLSFGTKWIHPADIFVALFAPSSPDAAIVYSFRLPRVLIALLAGGLLATSGFILQAALKNDLASPDVIGLNKASAFFIVILSFFVNYPSKTSLVSAALFGGMVGIALIYFVSQRFRFSSQTIIISGIALSFLFDALIKLFTFAEKQLLMKQLVWLTGSLWGRYWEMVPLLFLTAVAFTVFFFLTTDRFFLLQLDNAIIPTLGKKTKSLTWLYLIIASIVTSITVSSVGAIGFIGLLSPHIGKRLLSKYTPLRFVLIFFIGSIILLLSDLIGRSIIAPVEIPAGIIVSIIGAPYFLFILIAKKHGGRI